MDEKLKREIEKLDYDEIKALKSACLVFSQDLRENELKQIFDRFNELYEARDKDFIF